MPMTCQNCGNTNHVPGTRVCSVCGAALVQPVAVATPPMVAPSQPAMLVTSSGRRYRLHPNSETLIGSRGCAITLTEPGVAPQHARIQAAATGFVLEVLASNITVNGRPVQSSYGLQPGDSIQIGSATLVYQGPASIATAPPAAASRPQPISPVPAPVVPLPPPLLVPTPAASPAVRLKSWSGKQPATEGEVVWLDGPHMMSKGNMAGKLATAAVLGLFLGGRLAFLPFMGKQEIPVWFMRIKDFKHGRQVSVILGGQPSALPQLGDIIAVWGNEKDGNIILDRAYNYATDSDIKVKR